MPIRPPQCSFCLMNITDDGVLIASDLGNVVVYICDTCVQLAHSRVCEWRAEKIETLEAHLRNLKRKLATAGG